MSNSSLATRAVVEPERSTAFGSITGSYATIGTPLAHPAINVIFDNQTDKQVAVSWDGTNTWKTFAPSQSIVLDIQSNRGRGEAMMIAQNTQFYIKYLSAPGSGGFYISVIYGFNGDNK